MTDDGRPNFRRIIGVFLLVVVAVVAAWWLIRYLTTGQITVITDSADSTISITKIEDGATANKSQGTHGQKSVTERLKAGQYIISVGGKSLTANKKVSLDAREHLTYKVDAPSPISSEPVLGQGAMDVAADSSKLVYVKPSSNEIWSVDRSNGAPHQLYVGHIFQSVQWANTNLGVGRTTENRFLILRNGVASPLPVPEPYNPKAKMNYSLAPDGSLFISFGHNVYFSPDLDTYKKIYTADSDDPLLVGTKGRVAVIRPEEDQKSSSDNQDENSSSNIVVVDTSGNSVEGNIEGLPEVQLAWSPDGSKLASAGGALSGQILDKSLKPVADLPNFGVASPYWLDNDTLLYGADGLVWSYDISKGVSSVMSNIGPGLNINQIVADGDKSYLYVATSDNGSAEALSRVGLKGQPVPSYISPLSSFLPETIGVCELDYVNFFKPTITIKYPKLGTDPDLCIKSAKGELRYYHMDPARFDFVTIPFIQVY